MERSGAANWDYIPIREIMNENPVTVSPKMSLNHAASLMQEKDVSSLIVTRKDEPIGTLSEKNITRRLVAKDLKPNQVKVKDIMSRSIVTVEPDEDLASVAKIMARKRMRIVSIVQNRKLIGILTQRDLLTISPTLLELSREHARINNNGPSIGRYHSGYCEICHSYSDELEDTQGMMICKNCQE